MDLHELECIQTIAEEENITAAAEKLYLSPSALTQKINHLEKELGCRLFYRSRAGCFLTDAGKLYVQGIHDILAVRQETYRKIGDLTQQQEGRLAIGFPPERGSQMFSAVYPRFQAAFPGVRIRLAETSVRRQQEMIAGGKLDIGFLSLMESQYTKDVYIKLRSEEMYLAVPASWLTEPSDTKNPADFRSRPFALMYGQSTMREWQDLILKQYHMNPEILLTTSRSTTVLQMVSLGVCCGLIPDFYRDLSLKNVRYCRLPERPCWNLCASYKQGAYLNHPAREFIRFAAEYYREAEA